MQQGAAPEKADGIGRMSTSTLVCIKMPGAAKLAGGQIQLFLVSFLYILNASVM